MEYVPRLKDPVLEDRDRQMLNEYLSGQYTVQELAERYGISRQRVYQIISRFAGSDVPEEVSIDEHLIMLQNVRGVLYREVMKGPPPQADVKGNLVPGLSGEYLPDLHSYAGIATVFMKMDESIRKLKARDQPRRKIALEEAQLEIIAHLEKLRQEIPVKVIPELPPPPSAHTPSTGSP